MERHLMILSKQEMSSDLHILKCHRYREKGEDSDRRPVKRRLQSSRGKQCSHRGDKEEGADLSHGLSESLNWSTVWMWAPLRDRCRKRRWEEKKLRE